MEARILSRGSLQLCLWYCVRASFKCDYQEDDVTRSGAPQPSEMTREKLLRLARIFGPSSTAAKALSDMDRIEAEGDHALCMMQRDGYVVIRVEVR